MQNIIRQAIYAHDSTSTQEIKEDKSKEIWTSINKLGGIISQKQKVYVYDEHGTLLQEGDVVEEMREALENIYTMHSYNIN